MLESNLTSTPVLFGEIQREILDLKKEEQDKVVEPTLNDIIVKPDSEMQTLGSVLVKGVTASIDENIKPENIKLGTSILGIEGNVAPDKPDQEKTIYPSEEEQIVVADNGFELAKVIAKPVETESFEIAPSTSEQVVKASDGKYIKEVVVGAIEDIEPEISEQETKLAKLEEDVNALSDKPVDKLQLICDTTKSLKNFFSFTNSSSPRPTDEEVVEIMKGIDTSNVTTMENMFRGLNQVIGAYKDLSEVKIDALNCTTFKNMFLNTGLVEPPMFVNTHNVTDMNYMFGTCRLTKIPSIDTSSVWNFDDMFSGNSDLIGNIVVPYNTNKAVRMDGMFYGCKKITQLDLSSFDTQNVNYMPEMFFNCNTLENIIGTLNMINVSSVNDILAGCTALRNVVFSNINKASLKLNYCKNLTNESLINTFKELWDLTGQTSKTLTLSTTSKENIANIYVKLIDVTDDMRAEDEYIDNKKPCVVCESTDEGAMTLTEYAISKNWAIA